MYDCVIVGAGVTGLMTALELRAVGLDVCVLERAQAGRESSWAGGGILSPLYPWRYPPEVTRLAGWSRAEYPGLAARLLAETGIDPEYEAGGLLILDGGDRVGARDWARANAEPMEVLDPSAVAAREPAVRVVETAALWLPAVAQVRNPRLMRALRAAAVTRGVTLLEGREVTRLRLRGGRFAAAETPGGPISGGACVLATGAWTAALLRPLGSAVAVEPVKGEMVLFRGPPGRLHAVVLDGGRYVIPRRDGRVLVGSTLARTGFDRLPTPAARQELTEAGWRIVPSLRGQSIEVHWAGLRPGSPGGVPYITGHPSVAGLFVNAGQYRNGLVMAPASARLCADLVLGRVPTFDPSGYAWEGPRPDSGWD